jgi:trehalose 6-phosphate synthase
MPVAGSADVLIASNRGPVSFAIDEQGRLSLRRGGGGLVSGLSAVAGETGETGLWICTALTDADRAATRRAGGRRLDEAGHDTGGAAVRMLDIDATTFNRAYNAVANSVLWFVHHLLYDIPTVPHFDASFRRDWDSYVAYNATFADAIASDAAPGAKVLVQDYHLTLVPRLLRGRRPDLRVGHFSHTPWAPADYFDLLPADVAREILLGVLGADRAAFLTIRWARAFLACCARVLHVDVDYQALTVTHDGRVTAVGVHALGIDGDYLRERSQQPDVEAKRATLLETVGQCRVVLRVDRTELSKNIVRGLAAYRELLRTRPEWRGKVVHVAFAYPSRHDLPVYREYTASVQRIAAEIEDEFGTTDWRPLVLAVDDDFARSLAAYRIADVLVVNPIRDGMNLVAKEVPVVSERGVALVLSREAGAVHELGGDAAVVNPYDVSETAAALHRALTMPDAERAARTQRLAAAATALPPRRWFADQLAALSD